MNRLFAMLGLLVLSVLVPARADVPQYLVTDLGTFGGRSAYVTDINSSGHMVGYVYFQQGQTRAFLWDGSYHDLGIGRANAVNDAGVVVGSVGGDQIGYTNPGFIWDGQRHEVPQGYLTDINKWGETTGQGIPSFHAFLQRGGIYTDLGSPGGGSSFGYAVSDTGAVVGVSANDGLPSQYVGFLWKDGDFRQVFTLGGQLSRASDINDSDWVVGWSDSSSDTRGFFWDGHLHDLGSGLFANGLNNMGYVVGSQRDRPEAFVWTNGALLNLPLLGSSCNAIAINDSGVIVGTALFSGHRHVVIWEPVPEPSSIAGLFMGLVPMFLPFRKRIRDKLTTPEGYGSRLG